MCRELYENGIKNDNYVFLFMWKYFRYFSDYLQRRNAFPRLIFASSVKWCYEAMIFNKWFIILIDSHIFLPNPNSNVCYIVKDNRSQIEKVNYFCLIWTHRFHILKSPLLFVVTIDIKWLYTSYPRNISSRQILVESYSCALFRPKWALGKEKKKCTTTFMHSFHSLQYLNVINLVIRITEKY